MILILNDYFSIYFVKRVSRLGPHKRVNVHFVNHNLDEFNLLTTQLQKSGKLRKLSRNAVNKSHDHFIKIRFLIPIRPLNHQNGFYVWHQKISICGQKFGNQMKLIEQIE